VTGSTNADLVRRGFAHWNERRFDRVLDFFHEDAVWDMSPFGIPDMGAFRGHDGLRRFFAEWLRTFPDSTVEIEDVEQQGDWTLSVVLQRVSGGASGAPVPFRYGGIGHWRDGRLDLVENHPDLEQAGIVFKTYVSADDPTAIRSPDAEFS
jgi:ketosteroid isomerase-like protein